MADLILTIVQEPSDDAGFLAGFATTADMILAVGGRGDAFPTVLASSNARDFETRATPAPVGLRDVLAVGAAVWVCGERGLLAVSSDDGASWREIATATAGCLFGLARAADGAIWVVGDAGYAARLTGEPDATPERIDLGTDATLAAVYAVKDELVILGGDGMIRRWRAGQVTAVATGSARPLTALAVTRGSWVVVGDGGFLGRSPDGAWWSRVRHPVDADLEAIAALSDGQLVVVGDRGVVLVSRDDGRTWTAVASEITAHLWSAEPFGAGCLIGGDEGLVAKLAPRGDDAWGDRVNVFGGAKPLDAAFVAGPLGFIAGGGLAAYLAALADAGPHARREPGGSADDFLATYGVPVPPEAAAFVAQTAAADREASFHELRLDRPLLRAAPADANLFELAIRDDQAHAHGSALVEAFCGVVGIGSLRDGDSYHLELYEWDGPRQVVHVSHETGAITGVVAESLDSLAYLAAIVKAGDEHRISKDAYRIGLRKLRGKVAPPWHFAIAETDPDFVPLEPKRRDTEVFCYRARWICALLRHDGHAPLAGVRELFAPDLNGITPTDQLPARYEACEQRTPTALYATWRAFLFDEPELPAYLAIARAHRARLVRDAARLIDELLGGRNELGTIRDVRGWLAEIRALDLDPRRAPARVVAAPSAAESAAPDGAAAELARTPPAAWADLAWRWLEDGAAHRALVTQLAAQPAAQVQLREVAALGALAPDELAVSAARLGPALAPELEAVLVGCLVRGDDLADLAPATAAAGDAEDGDDKAPGWDAIDRALAPLYAAQEPMHYGTVLPAMLGGTDPLHGISVYARTEPVPHFHFVTYGFTDLFQKETDDPEESGFGFELTFRLVRAPDEERPPPWALNFLQNLGRYVFGSGNRFAAGHKMGLNGPIALGQDTQITAILFADDPELGDIDSPYGAARFVQVVGITDDEYKLIQEWSTPGLVEMLRTQWPFLTTDLARRSLLADPVVAAEVHRRVDAEGSSEDLSFGGDLTISRGPDGVTVSLGALYAAALPRAMRGRLRHGRPYELRGRNSHLRLEPGDATSVEVEADGATWTLAPDVVAELEAVLQGVHAGTYRLATWSGLTLVVTPTFIRDQRGLATDVKGIADPEAAQRAILEENARLAAAADDEDDDDEDDEDDDDDEDEDEDEDEDDDDEDDDDDGPPPADRVRAAIAMSERALRLSPDDEDIQFTHGVLLLEAERAGVPGTVDSLLGLLPTFGAHTRLNLATRLGKAEHPRFGEAVELALGDALPERILAGSTTPTGEGGAISSFGDVAAEIYDELGEAILAHAPERMPRFIQLLPDEISLLAKLAYHAVRAGQREHAIALYERLVALPMPDDGDERTEYLRALNNLCIQLHAAGDFAAAARVADRAQPVAHENPFIYHAAACAYVGIGDLPRAMKQVELAIEHDYDNLLDLERDTDLGPLRETPEFQAAFREWHARREGN